MPIETLLAIGGFLGSLAVAFMAVGRVKNTVENQGQTIKALEKHRDKTFERLDDERFERGRLDSEVKSIEKYFLKTEHAKETFISKEDHEKDMNEIKKVYSEIKDEIKEMGKDFKAVNETLTSLDHSSTQILTTFQNIKGTVDETKRRQEYLEQDFKKVQRS